MPTYVENFERLLGPGDVIGYEVVFHCPFEGCIAYDKKKFYVDPDLGGWFCFHCKQDVPGKVYSEESTEKAGGSWRDFVNMVGDEANLHLWPKDPSESEFVHLEPLPKVQASKIWTRFFNLCALHDDHAKLLIDRGIDPLTLGARSATMSALWQLEREFTRETVAKAGLCKPTEVGEIEPTICVKPGRILIPYWDEKGKKINYFVGYQRMPERREDWDEEDYLKLKKRWAKVAGPRGYTPILYGASRLPKEATFAVVDEGQLKAEAAIQRGLPWTGLQGMGSQHKEAVKELAKRKVKAVIILFDTQVGNEEEIDREAERLARELLSKNIPAFRARLPIEEGEVKVDTDSFLKTHSVEDLGNVLLEALNHPYIFDEKWLEVQGGEELIEEEEDE